MKKIIYLILFLVVAGVITMVGLRFYTQTHSPLESVSYKDIIQIDYCRPYKNDRDIFGELVPFNEVWRTGANEATKVIIKKDMNWNKLPVPAGEYSLWTIPGETSWEIILNKETGQWGVDFQAKANRNPEQDLIRFEVPSYKSDRTFEQFTIEFKMHDSLELELMWDYTIVVVPIQL